MKLNIEKVYDFIKLHADGEETKGVATAYIAEALNMQRTNVSSLLNQLVEEGRIEKSNGRPVKYFISNVNAGKDGECFFDIIGADGSLKHVIQLIKAAVLYPQKSLNIMLIGRRGTGKSRMARAIYEFAVEQGVLSGNAPYIQIHCRDYREEEELLSLELEGDQKEEGIFERAAGGILYFDNIQYLSSKLIRKIRKLTEQSACTVIVSFLDKSQVTEDFTSIFPMLIELPTLSERPLSERMEMVRKLLSEEAAKTKRHLIVRGDLMRCMLLYECEANYHQLQGDIKLGCANAYVREYKNTGDIALYVSDFEHHVRKGFLKYRAHREELEALVPYEYSYVFDGEKISISGESVYEQIDKKAQALNKSGLNEEEISMMLSTEVERSFTTYQRELSKEVSNREQLEILVDKKVMELVEDFLETAGKRLERIFSDSVFCGLCLHINAFVSGRRENKKIEKSQITELVRQYNKEYLLAAELSEKIEEAYGMELPLEETVWMALFICYPQREERSAGTPVVLYAFYGEGVATAIVKTIAGLTRQNQVYAYELAYERDSAVIYEQLKNYIVSIHQGKGVYVIYDSCFLSEMLTEMEEELGILIRQFHAPILTMGIELVRKLQSEVNPDEIYREALQGIARLAESSKRYIVTLCTTGKGGAEELKNYIEKYGGLTDTTIVPMSMSDKIALEKEFRKLMKTGTIHCVVGTFDPQLFSIPFISISDVFGIKKENLPKLLQLERQAKEKLDYTAIFEYLGEQLEHVDIGKLKRLLPEVISEINRRISELSLDTEVGLLIHMACCIDRLAGKGSAAANPRKMWILSQYAEAFQSLLKLVKPLEKAFHVILNDDEMAKMLAIIYQI